MTIIEFEGTFAIRAARLHGKLPEIFSDGSWRTVREPDAVAHDGPVRFRCSIAEAVWKITGLPPDYLHLVHANEVEAAREMLQHTLHSGPADIMLMLTVVPRDVRRLVALNVTDETHDRSLATEMLRIIT